MLIEEMHLLVEQDLQKINTFSERNIEPEEIDLFLRNEVTKFMKARSKPLPNTTGNSTMKRYEDLEELSGRMSLKVAVQEDGVTSLPLPYDYFAYVSSRVNMDLDCSNSTITTDTASVFFVPFSVSNIATTSYSWSIDTTTILDVMDVANADYLDADDKSRYLLKTAIDITLEKSSISNTPNGKYAVYWEVFNGVTYPNTFIVVDTTGGTTLTVEYNGVESEIDSTTYTWQQPPTTKYWGNSRLVELEFLPQVLSSHLAKSTPKSPVVSLQENSLSVWSADGCEVVEVDLIYIRKPNTLDLNLSSSLNLSRSLCIEIVTNTVAMMKSVLQGDYNSYVRQQTLIE